MYSRSNCNVAEFFPDKFNCFLNEHVKRIILKAASLAHNSRSKRRHCLLDATC